MTKKVTKVDFELVQKSRELIGKAIIDGLLTPQIGGMKIPSYYNQGDGGYWQNDGEGHTQGSGDYHQGTA